ncbi:energy transducer TonB family protein [Tateyamaria sp. SN3-11]|uniref:energy transducer TonB family protein n=1 Tax=Tateyamaria sp. SN3-11 TaxID=3092147 RepID=UPI0039ECB91C
MRRAAELLAFTAFALLGHLVVAGLRPPTEGADASGASGDTTVSLEASDAQVAALVEAWETPPEVAEPQQIQLPEPPNVSQNTAQTMPEISAPSSLPDVPSLAIPIDQAPSAPVVDTQPPAPPAPKVASTAPTKTARPALRPQQPRQRASVASTGQRAAGSGGGTAAGSERLAETATRDPAQVQSLTAAWGGAIRATIERRKRYPRQADGVSGQTVVSVTVGRNGSLISVAVRRSSGNAALDQAAVRAVTTARRFPNAPAGLEEASYTFSLPIQFSG